MEELRALRLKGYVNTKIVGMRYNYKDNDGHRLPNPLPGCPVSLQLEPSNPYHCNAIKVINEENNHHLGYIIRETADALSLILKDNSSVAARGIISAPQHRYLSTEVISCQILLFFSVPLELIPPLPPHLNFHENLTRPDFMLISSSFAYSGCTVDNYDSYVAHNIDPLPLRPQVEQPLSHPCSTNSESPRHVHDGDSTVPLNLSSKFQTQSQTQTEDEIQGAGQNSEVTCMKCKQMGGGPFFHCIQRRCPLLIHERCIVGVVGRTCLFCLFLARRGEVLRAKKGSDLYMTLKEKYREARKHVIYFFGWRTFVRLRELAGLEPLVPVPVQVACIVNMQCHTEGRMEEAAGKSTIMEKDDEREKKPKIVGCGKRRLPPRPRLHRACKTRTRAPTSM